MVYLLHKEQSNPTKKIIRENALPKVSIIFYDAIVLLGNADINQTERVLRVTG